MTVETFETEAEWLEARRRYVTSTEVAALFGQHPRLTAFELACIKRDPKLDQFEATERTRWGQALQEAIGERVAEWYGLDIEPLDLQLAVKGLAAASGDFMIRNVATNWTRGDGEPTAYFDRLGEGVLEIKNVDSLVYKNEWTDDDMPDHYEIQLQAEMLCWDTKWGVLAVLIGGNRLKLYIRERDEKVCELISTHCAEFMTNLAKGILPAPTMPEDAQMVIALHQYADPNKVYDATSDDYLWDLCKKYKECSAIASKATAERDSIKATILSRIGDAERVTNLHGFNLSASMRAPVEVAAHTRAGFRGFNLTVKKEKK